MIPRRSVARAAFALISILPLAVAPAFTQQVVTPPRVRGPGSATLLTPAAPPTNLYLTGSPAYTTISWARPGPPLRGFLYSVQRWLETDLDCCNAQVNGLSATQWTDEGVQWAGVYVYRVTAFYPDGRVGAADVRYVRPDPVNPTRFSATVSPGLVTLRWDAVPDVSWYELTGPNIPFGSFQVAPTQTFFLVRNLAGGTHTWRIGSAYSSAKAPAPVFSPPNQFPVATAVVP
ncbi:MAG: hypothetical protein AB7L66_12350 [Gemmatimonadales bacterium]